MPKNILNISLKTKTTGICSDGLLRLRYFIVLRLSSAPPAGGAMARASLAVGAADAFLPTLFGSVNIQARGGDDNDDNNGSDNTFHRHYFFAAASALTSRLALAISAAITTANTITAIRPPTKPLPRDPVVIRVPI